MANLRKKFSSRLQTLRRKNGITQEELAARCGISVEFISNLERGINAPSFETLEKLSLALNLPIHDFFLFDSEDSSAKI